MNLYNLYFDVAGKVVVGGGSDKKTNFMDPTVVSGVKLDDPLMQVILKKKKDIKNKKDQNIHKEQTNDLQPYTDQSMKETRTPDSFTQFEHTARMDRHENIPMFTNVLDSRTPGALL